MSAIGWSLLAGGCIMWPLGVATGYGFAAGITWLFATGAILSVGVPVLFFGAAWVWSGTR